MSTFHFPASNHKQQPWKNGLGVSQTIAEFPEGAGFDKLLWQVGATAIEKDCPFSALPWMDRQFMVIEGAGVELTSTDERSIDETGARRTRKVLPLQPPYAFRGDWRTNCRLLGGPVKVFNVMTRRGRYAATVEILQDGPSNLGGSPNETVLAVDLRSLDAWKLSGPEDALARPAGTFAVVRIREAGK